MTDPISARLREVSEYAKTDTSSVIWDYPEVLSSAADHTDAQDATIKALVDALGVYADPQSWVSNPHDQGVRTSQMDYDKGHRARTALAAVIAPQ